MNSGALRHSMCSPRNGSGDWTGQEVKDLQFHPYGCGNWLGLMDI